MLGKWAAKFGYHPNEIISLFRLIGYGCYTINDRSLEPFEIVDENTKATNYVFVHNSHDYRSI